MTYIYKSFGNIVEEVQQAIKELTEQTHTKADTEKLHSKGAIWSYRLNQAKRLLFTYIKKDRRYELVVLEYLDRHQYDRACFLNNNALARALDDFEGYFNSYNPEEVSATAVQAPEITEPRIARIGIHNGHYIELSDRQEQAIKAQLPLVVMGCAGSGKSCVAMSLIAQYVQNATRTDENPVHKILYMAQSPILLDSMRRQWEQYAREYEIPGWLEVTFASYEEVAMKSAPTQIKKDRLVGYNAFEAWFKKQKKSEEIAACGAQRTYRELRVRSGCSNNDEYSSLGERQGSENTLREKINELYSAYKTALMQQGKIDLALFSLPTTGNQFHFIIADEAPDLSRLQLRELIRWAIEKQIAFLMDPHQDLRGDLSRSWLTQLFFSLGIPLGTIELGPSYRCPTRVADAVTRVIAKKYQLTQGTQDKREETSVNPYIDKESGLGNVLALTPEALQELTWLYEQRHEAYFAVVIMEECFRDEANKYFSRDRIFTPEEIKGLEYPITLLFNPFGGETAKEVEQALSASSPRQSETYNRGQRNTNIQHLTFFNRLITAMTRASKVLIICTPNKKPSILLEALGDYIKSTKEQYVSLQNGAACTSSHEEWEAELLRLVQLGELTRAAQLHERLTKIPGEKPFLGYKAAILPCIEEAPRPGMPHETTKKRVPPSAPERTPRAQGEQRKPPEEIETKTMEPAAAKTQVIPVAASVIDSLKKALLQPTAARISVLLSLYSPGIIIGTVINDKSETFFQRIIESKEGVIVFASAVAQLHARSKNLKHEYRDKIQGYILAINALGGGFREIRNKIMAALALYEELYLDYRHQFSAWMTTLKNSSGTIDNPCLAWLALQESREGSPSGIKVLQNLIGTQKNILALQSEAWGLVDPAHKIITAFHCLCTTPQGVGLLRQHPRVLKKVSPKTWGLALAAGANITPFYLLCSTPDGQTLLEEHSYILDAVSSETWGLALTEAAGANANITPLYWLCRTLTGMRLLTTHLAILKKISSKTWGLPLTEAAGEDANTTPFYWLCGTPEGRALLSRRPDILEKISQEVLGLARPKAAGADANTTPFYWLCTPEGLALLEANLDVLGKISAETWSLALTEAAGEDANTTAFYLICCTPEGRALLSRRPDILEKISVETWSLARPKAAGLYANVTPFYWLCGTPEGRALLSRRPDILEKISQEVLGLARPKAAGADANTTPFYWLCSSSDGRALLKAHPYILEKISAETWGLPLTKAAAQNANKTPLYWLSSTPDGRALLSRFPDILEKIPAETRGLYSFTSTHPTPARTAHQLRIFSGGKQEEPQGTEEKEPPDSKEEDQCPKVI